MLYDKRSLRRRSLALPSSMRYDAGLPLPSPGSDIATENPSRWESSVLYSSSEIVLSMCAWGQEYPRGQSRPKRLGSFHKLQPHFMVCPESRRQRPLWRSDQVQCCPITTLVVTRHHELPLRWRPSPAVPLFLDFIAMCGINLFPVVSVVKKEKFAALDLFLEAIESRLVAHHERPLSSGQGLRTWLVALYSSGGRPKNTLRWPRLRRETCRVDS
jgi:hypothetical protein